MANKPEKPDAPGKSVHAPGLWVLYFSFAAVPVFGLGELLVRADDAAGRRSSFLLLFTYLASALGLLLLTSFLGLRRYLRQRYLPMPPGIARSWIRSGAGLALLVLGAAVLLPRPATPYSLATFVTKLTSPVEAGTPDSQSQTEGSSSGQSGQQRTADTASADSPAPGQPPPQSATKSPGQRTSTASVPAVPAAAVQAAQWLPYLVAGILILFVLFRFWPEIRAGLTAVRAKRKPSSKPAGLPPEAPALLPDPFRSGQADRMSLPDLVFYTFEGLQRWARSRGFEPAESETPIEFAERLSEREPVLSGEILRLSNYFSHVVYGGGQVPDPDAIPVLRRLWSVIGFGR